MQSSPVGSSPRFQPALALTSAQLSSPTSTHSHEGLAANEGNATQAQTPAGLSVTHSALGNQLRAALPEKSSASNKPQDFSKTDWEEMPKAGISPELEQKVNDMFADKEEFGGFDMKLHTSKDGNKTFLMDDGDAIIDIDTNKTWSPPKSYDHTVSKTWGTGIEGQKYAPLDKFEAGRDRSNLESHRLESVVNAIKEGIELGPVSVSKNPNDTFHIENGNHRYHAALDLKLETIPYKEGK